MAARHRPRLPLALAWAAVMVAWCVSALFALGLTSLAPCGGDGGQPYAAPASPAGRYCETFDGYLDSGEPGELTTALVYLWPVALLLALGAFAAWKRSVRLVVGTAAILFALVVAHVALAFALPNRCSPDDESVSSCQHY